MANQIEYASVAELIEEVKPYAGQDCVLKYMVYSDRTLSAYETITGMALVWVLFEDEADTYAILVKSVGSGLVIATPIATVTLSAANTGALIVGREYKMQLLRNDAGNLYPLTGFGKFIPRKLPPLAVAP